MKKLLLSALCLLLLLTGCTPKQSAAQERVYATISVAGFGDIKAELYPNIAPQSVYNFVSLARQGYYDGVLIHRVEPGFVLQGGDPTGTGRGGPGYKIKGEFEANGWVNTLSHTRGVLSMARSAEYDSAGSQFFIMHGDFTGLDGKYAAFGKVLEGMEVVDAIAKVETEKFRPLTDVVITTITIEGPELPEPQKLKGK